MASLYPARLYKRPTGWYPLIDTGLSYTFTPAADATFETEATIGGENVRSVVVHSGVLSPDWTITIPEGTYSVRITSWAFLRAANGDTADFIIGGGNVSNESGTPNSSFSPSPLVASATFAAPSNTIEFTCVPADGTIAFQVEVYYSNGELGVAP